MVSIYTYLKGRIKSFGFAFKGIYTLVQTQPNAQIHLLAIIVIIGLSLAIGLESWEWCVILICMSIVLLAEAMNTAIEFLADQITTEYQPLIGKAKDVAAGGVLLSVIFCGIAWGIIFIPKILVFFH